MSSPGSLLRTVLIGVAAFCAVESALAVALVRGPYLGRPSDSSVAVIWNTDTAADSRVDYAAPDGVWRTATSPEVGTRHVVAITGLPSGAEINYRVLSAGVQLAPESSFRAPRDGTETRFRFAVIGDTAEGGSVLTDIADRLVESGADFAVHTGDVVYPTGAQQNYDKTFFLPLARWLLHGPVLPALGNHDVMTGRGSAYLSNFVVPPNGVTQSSRFYAIRQANALFVCLDVESSSYGADSPQYDWLVRTLSASTATWKFVYFHEPPYSSGHPNHLVRLILCPLFEHFGVDIVFSGHVHLYERTWPIRDFVPSGRGVVYITEGGGGSPLSDFHQEDYTAFVAARFGYTEVQIDGGTLDLTAHDPSGAVFDSLVLDKPQPAPSAGVRIHKGHVRRHMGRR
ncbi:MAG: metallophosphoesterase family protein [Acidobacteria bacterium]|nr:MAG: metallophosphoesterase family protein [Acidobacteriota bacterium]